jgi:hypothetical protein
MLPLAVHAVVKASTRCFVARSRTALSAQSAPQREAL